MPLHRIACCAALALGLSQMAAPASACEGTDCAPAATAKPSKPLQLGKFMRPSGAKSAAAHATKSPTRTAKAKKRSVHVAKMTKKAAAPSIPLPRAPSPSQSLAAEAASAFASQPAADVRVVDSNEVNEIDLAAGPALPETNGAGQAVQEPEIADTTAADATASIKVAELKSEDLERSAEKLRLASLESTPAALAESPARAARTSLPWIERFWSAIQGTFLALTAGWHYLFG